MVLISVKCMKLICFYKTFDFIKRLDFGKRIILTLDRATAKYYVFHPNPKTLGRIWGIVHNVLAVELGLFVSVTGYKIRISARNK